MKKSRLLVIPTIILFMLTLSNISFPGEIGYKWRLAKMDSVLVNLLSISYDDPFWTPTIRQDYLKMGVKRVSSVLGICPFTEFCSFAPNVSRKQILPATKMREIVHAIRWIDTDSAYSLIKIKSNDVGQKEIATSVPAHYYYVNRDGDDDYVYIYPPDPSDTVWITIYGYRTTDDFAIIRAIAHHIILEYALFWCYQQKSEIEIARAKREWADIMLYDLKNNLENRPIDIVLKRKVLSK